MVDRSNLERPGAAGANPKQTRSGRPYPALTGRYYLVKDMNCALATLEAFQDVFGLRDDLLLKAVTGFEGGVVAGGSTCGVITAGALGLAQLWREATAQDPAGSPALMGRIADYVAWFHGAFGTTLCRERTGVDFHTAGGLSRYFLPGDRVLRCISHIGTALAYLEREGAAMTARPDTMKEDRCAAPYHCASAVLKDVREKAGLGDRRIEQIAACLSGGVGLSGGICGALTGAVMGINYLAGMDVRRYGRVKIIRDFAVGHINLLIARPRWMPEPFGIGREIVRRFHERAGTNKCRLIVGRDFTGLSDFSAHLAGSGACRDMIALSSDLALEAIERWR
jgi:C_GCAxxG_C_C family probable redox protein